MMRFAVVAALAAAFMAGAGAGFVIAREPPAVTALLSASQTVIGQNLKYPDGPLKVTAAIVTLPPGAETGWHTHPAPIFAYILEGEMTVEYEGQGSRIYKAGDGIMEAVGSRHNGRNTGSGAARILSVLMGAEGMEIAAPAAAPSGGRVQP